MLLDKFKQVLKLTLPKRIVQSIQLFQQQENIFESLKMIKIKNDDHDNELNQLVLENYAKSSENSKLLSDLFNKFGSDKSTSHDYHKIYGNLFEDKLKVKSILEIGLGTNNPKLPSTMGVNGKPGASLRAFKEFFSNSTVYGADVDKNILFNEDRIQTFFVDQTDTSSFDNLNSNIPPTLDLIIDDGLHIPFANINTLNFAIKKLNLGGYFIIEDISYISKSIWEHVSNLLPDYLSSTILDTKQALMFIVKKIK